MRAPIVRMLTIRECAERLRVSYRAAYALVAGGHIRGIRAGIGPCAPWRIEPADLEAWIARPPQEGTRRAPATPAETDDWYEREGIERNHEFR